MRTSAGLAEAGVLKLGPTQGEFAEAVDSV